MPTRDVLFCREFIFALSIFLLGYFFRYLQTDFDYKVSSQLLSAIVYIQSYEQQNNQLPSRYEFKEWSENVHENWRFRYYPNFLGKPGLDEPGRQRNTFIIGAWTGDELQYFYSWDQTFRYENEHAAEMMRLEGADLDSGYRIKGGKILVPLL